MNGCRPDCSRLLPHRRCSGPPEAPTLPLDAYEPHRGDCARTDVHDAPWDCRRSSDPTWVLRDAINRSAGVREANTEAFRREAEHPLHGTVTIDLTADTPLAHAAEYGEDVILNGTRYTPKRDEPFGAEELTRLRHSADVRHAVETGQPITVFGRRYVPDRSRLAWLVYVTRQRLAARIAP